jgi:hypothetical protein
VILSTHEGRAPDGYRSRTGYRLAPPVRVAESRERQRADDERRAGRAASAYDASFIDLWVRACSSSGETRSFCQCAIDAYTARLQPHEFETAAAVARGGGTLAELPEHLRHVVKAVERDCR